MTRKIHSALKFESQLFYSNMPNDIIKCLETGKILAKITLFFFLLVSDVIRRTLNYKAMHHGNVFKSVVAQSEVVCQSKYTALVFEEHVNLAWPHLS